MGNPWGSATWIYASGEYHVEAYEIEVEGAVPAGTKDKIELRDWRLVIGVRNGNGWVTSFLEAGWVIGRKVEFLRTPGFNVSTGFIVRGGVQF